MGGGVVLLLVGILWCRRRSRQSAISAALTQDPTVDMEVPLNPILLDGHANAQALPKDRQKRRFRGSEMSVDIVLKSGVRFAAEYVPQCSCADAITHCELPGVASRDIIAKESVAIANERLAAIPLRSRLPLELAVALVAYSYDLGTLSMDSEGNDNLFFVLNQHLTQRSPYLKRPCTKAFLYYLMKAHESLPVFKGTVYRGVGPAVRRAIEAQYKPNAHVHWSSFTSTAVEKRVAEGFAQAGGVMFIINLVGDNGRRIDAYSAFPGECEALLSPNSTFFVKHIDVQGPHCEIYLEEIFGVIKY